MKYNLLESRGQARLLPELYDTRNIGWEAIEERVRNWRANHVGTKSQPSSSVLSVIMDPCCNKTWIPRDHTPITCQIGARKSNYVIDTIIIYTDICMSLLLTSIMFAPMVTSVHMYTSYIFR